MKIKYRVEAEITVDTHWSYENQKESERLKDVKKFLKCLEGHKILSSGTGELSVKLRKVKRK